MICSLGCKRPTRIIDHAAATVVDQDATRARLATGGVPGVLIAGVRKDSTVAHASWILGVLEAAGELGMELAILASAQLLDGPRLERIELPWL
jgi:hypothetical protein